MDGKLQDTGREAQAVVKESVSSPEEDRFVIDLRPAYIRSVPHLKKLERTMIHRRAPPGEIVISDEFEFERPSKFGVGLVSFGEWKAAAPDTMIFREGQEAVQVKVGPGDAPFVIRREPLDANLVAGRKAFRVGIDLQAEALTGKITCTVTPITEPHALSPSAGVALAAADLGAAAPSDLSAALHLEAEAHSAEKGGAAVLDPKIGASGGQALKSWDAEGHALTWEFTTPQSGRYGILVRHCGEVSASRAVQIDGRPPGGIDKGTFMFAATGGWSNHEDQWRESWLAQGGRIYAFDLKEGAHTLTLINSGGSMNIDWLKIVPVK